MHNRHAATGFVSRRSAYAALAFGAVLVASLAAAPGIARAQQVVPEAGQISVSAEGRVTAAPDMATLTLGVQQEAPTAGEAVAAMSEDAAGVLAAIEAAGIATRDVQTSGLSLSPTYARPDRQSDGPPEIVGYRAETTVSVRVREIASVGAVLDAVVGKGANLFRGIAFGVAEPGPLLDEARREAVAEAARQAALYAEAAGVGLGRLIRLDAEGGTPRPQMMRAEMSMADSPGVPVAAGEVALTARVRMIYEIAEN